MAKKGNFTRIPFSLFDKLSEREMDLKDVLVYFGITRNIDGFPLSYRRISNITGVSRSMVQKSVQRLVANRLIRFTVAKTTHTVVSNGTSRNFVNDILLFRNLVDFDVEKYREFPNSYLHLVSSAKQVSQMYGVAEASQLTPIDIGILMYIKRRKFENDKVLRPNDLFQINSYEDSKTLGITRTTFRKSIKRLTTFRFIRINRLDRTVLINNPLIKNFLTFKIDLIKKQSVKKIANPDKFNEYDRVYLRFEIEQAVSRIAVGAMRRHVLDLKCREYISETEFHYFTGLCDTRESHLKNNPDEQSTEQFTDPRELFPLEITTSNANRVR